MFILSLLSYSTSFYKFIMSQKCFIMVPSYRVIYKQVKSYHTNFMKVIRGYIKLEMRRLFRNGGSIIHGSIKVVCFSLCLNKVVYCSLMKHDYLQVHRVVFSAFFGMLCMWMMYQCMCYLASLNLFSSLLHFPPS